MKKLVSLTALLLIMNSILIAQVAVAPALGDGTEENPYQIATLENLYWIAADNDVVPEPDYTSRMSSHYIQTDNIDATETQNWFAGEGWKPIGKFFTFFHPDNYPFTGSYDGQGNAIDNFFINRENSEGIGLFSLANGATINNLSITNVDINGGSIVGIIVGLQENNSSITNCYSTGNVSGNSLVGGLVGMQWDSTISNSYSTASTASTGNAVGGLVGEQIDSTISNCYSLGIISGGKQIGGLTGRQANSTISNCYSTGSVSGNDDVGGLVGEQSNSTIGNCKSTMNVSGNDIVGGLVGYHYNNSIVNNSYFTGNVNGSNRVGGLVGRVLKSIVNNSYYNYENVLINDVYIITIGAVDNETFNSWFDNGLYLNIDDYLSNDEGKYLINSVDDFAKLLAFGQFENYSFKLTSNLDFEEHPDFFIPYLSGDFDGNGLFINNIVINMESYSNIGLFGYTNDTTIENLMLTNFNIEGYMYVGGLVGLQDNNTTVTNCYITASVSGTYDVGGMVGVQGYNSTVSRSYSNGCVNGSYAVGGLVGRQFSSTVIKSHSTGCVSGDMAVGGLLGYQLNSTVNNCYSTGNVTGFENIGGLIGWNRGYINNSYSTGSVSGESDTGGMVGLQESESSITNSYWNIETAGQETSAGGEGRTTAEMTFPYAENTYVDWDFSEIWAADEEYEVNSGYPYLREETNSIEEDNLIIPSASINLSNYPNPFNPTTTIAFSGEYFAPNEQITLEIYNIKGQRVSQFKIKNEKSKMNEVIWNGKDSSGKPVSSGVYLYRVEGKNASAINKMMLLK